jgi:regulatory protein
VVTSLVAKRSGGERVVVYLDGARAFELSAEVADREGLRPGLALSLQATEALQAQDAPFRARDRAVRLIAVRDRSCHEVEARLLQAGFSPEVAAGAVEWLSSLGYLDDARFASRYAAEKAKSGWGSRRIAAELGRLGVERTLVGEAVAEAFAAGPDEAETGDGASGLDPVLNLARRRFAREFAADPATAARRLAGFLARRGFDWDTIHVVARTLQMEVESRETQELS